MKLKYSTVIILLLLVLFSCKKERESIIDHNILLTTAPAGLPAIPFPKDNQFSLEKWKLGKQLFYDSILSVDYSISCASCHKPELAFSDDLSTSPGAGNAAGTRNAPSLANVAYHPYFTREGGVPTLEMQILVPIQEHNEFNFNIVDIAERMKTIPEYVAASKKLFNRDPDAFVITRSITTFERTLVSGNSLYDKFIQGDTSSLSASAYRGMQLFFSNRTNCSNCHSSFNFTDYSFKNNGLYTKYNDIGRSRFTRNSEDESLFKVPSLRNVGVTAPYMHDGSIHTLKEVVEHYNNGGHNHPNKSKLVRPLHLSEQEQADLVSFLNSLTDHEFINNQIFYNNVQE